MRIANRVPGLLRRNLNENAKELREISYFCIVRSIFEYIWKCSMGPPHKKDTRSIDQVKVQV